MGEREPNRKYDCVLKFLENPFYSTLRHEQREKCTKMDGHVPRNMRVALTMIDLAAPYINISKTDLDKSKKKIDVWWKIGASIKVKNTWLYSFTSHDPVKCNEFKKKKK